MKGDRKVKGTRVVQWLYYDELNEYGVDPHWPTGFFFTADVPLQLVARFPHLHIISSYGDGRFVNRYVPGCASYYVSEEASDPTIEWFVEELTREGLIEILNDIRGDGSDEKADALADRLGEWVLNMKEFK